RSCIHDDPFGGQRAELEVLRIHMSNMRATFPWLATLAERQLLFDVMANPSRSTTAIHRGICGACEMEARVRLDILRAAARWKRSAIIAGCASICGTRATIVRG